jgi:hypothetical protein
MLLGKRFSRFQRSLNAKVTLDFGRKDGTRIRLPRKLRMLTIMRACGVEGIKRSAFENHKNLLNQKKED